MCLTLGDKKETARSAARPSSRRVIEYKQSEKAPEFAAAEGAAEAPEPAKEIMPRVPKPAAAERTSSAAKVMLSSSEEGRMADVDPE